MTGSRKLAPEEIAPDFTTNDVNGNVIKLRDYAGRKLMLSFYRFASCPLCNLRVHELVTRADDLESQGLHLIAFFQSPAESIRRYIGRKRLPFPIVADPQQIIYRRYAVAPSWSQVLSRDVVRRARRAFANGFWPGAVNGNIAMVPADFLVNETQTVHTAYYGRDIADHLPLETIERFLTK